MTQSTLPATFADILKHTHGLGIYEMLKITDTDGEVLLETVDESQSVIFKGKLNNALPGLNNAMIGLSRMGIIDGYLKYSGFKEESSSVNIVNKAGTDIPVEIEFKDASGTTANYRFMPTEIVELKLQDIEFTGADYDFTFSPSPKNRSDLNHFNSILDESYFVPKIEGGLLHFYIGDEVSDRTRILITDQTGGVSTFDCDFKWPLDIVLRILRLGDNVTISFTGDLLQIQVHSNYGVFTYLLPPKG